MSVWHKHGTSWRGYHWAMPVDRKTQDLARVAMGGVWLLVVIAVTLVLAAPFALARHGTELINERTAWMWLSFFTGPLTIYLFCSLAALRSASPVAWIVGVSAGMIVMTLTFSSTPLWPALRWPNPPLRPQILRRRSP